MILETNSSVLWDAGVIIEADDSVVAAMFEFEVILPMEPQAQELIAVGVTWWVLVVCQPVQHETSITNTASSIPAPLPLSHVPMSLQSSSPGSSSLMGPIFIVV